MRRPRSFFSGEAFFVKPTGSQRSSGTGCGILNWSPASGELNEGDDLPLARLRDLVPELGRRLGGVVARDVDGQP